MNDESTGSITCLPCTQVTRDQVTLHRMCTGGVELKLWDQLPSSMVKKRARSVRCKVRDFAIALRARKVSGAFEKRAPVAAEIRNSRYMCCKEKQWVDAVQFWEKEKTVYPSHCVTSVFLADRKPMMFTSQQNMSVATPSRM